jgi:orotidine-5'-phosphate decarboxylase
MRSEKNNTGPRVIVALDFPTAAAALAFTARITPQQCRVKVGYELFTCAGPAIVEKLVQQGFDVFLDLKYHDIPNTVASACAAAARLGVWMLNVHTLGGRNMMLAAREAVDKSAHRPLLIGVTVLTSHTAGDLQEIGFGGDTESQVLRLAQLAKQSGLDGVVCSAQEASRLRAVHGTDFCLVTPGIRPADSDHGDQARVVTPSEAVRAGSDYLVIGRPVTQAGDPDAVLAAINRELAKPS